MIVTPTYLIRNYLGVSQQVQNPDAIAEFIAMAQGAVEEIIRQPLERREVAMIFAGTGGLRAFVPYTLQPAPVTLEVMQSGEWVEHDDASSVLIQDQCAYLRTGWSTSAEYRLTIATGLAPCVDEEVKSSDLVDPRYGKLLRAVCDLAYAKMQDHPSTQTNGLVRFGVTSVSEQTGGGSRSVSYVDAIKRWSVELAIFRRLPSW